jgi:DNA-binding XRE family transcriptional regulator
MSIMFDFRAPSQAEEPSQDPGAVLPTKTSEEAPASAEPFTVAPFKVDLPTITAPLSSFTPLVRDERAITRLLETIWLRSGLTQSEIALRMGITQGTIHQFISGRRFPSLQWFLRYCEAVGYRVMVELPPRLKPW